jgi:succinate dehydrogenase hydrophobic anchor subunit
MLHFAIEDTLGLMPQHTIFGYEYGTCMSYMIITQFLFLAIMHLKRRKTDLFAVIAETERKIYSRVLFISISICAIYSARVLYLYLSGKTDVPILLNILATIFMILIGTLYFLLEQKNIRLCE